MSPKAIYSPSSYSNYNSTIWTKVSPTEFLGFHLVFPSTCRIPLKTLAAQGAKVLIIAFLPVQKVI